MPSAVSFLSIRDGKTDGDTDDKVRLSIEEFETVRLIDYNGLTQEECSVQMHVSRTTVQRMYNEARRKIASFLVKGSSLQICGGNYEICKNSERCCKKFTCGRLMCASADSKPPAECSKCPAASLRDLI